jgi:hypothetical protein
MKRNRPAGAVKNRPLGTQAAPACEGGVLAPVRPVHCVARRLSSRRGILGASCDPGNYRATFATA